MKINKVNFLYFLSFFYWMPLYLNLRDPFKGLIWTSGHEHAIEGLIPFPVGAILFIFSIIFINLDRSLKKSSFSYLNSRAKLLFITCFIFSLFIFVFYSNLSITRSIQLTFPILIFIFLRVPNLIIQLKVLFCSVLGLVIFQLIHLLGLFIDMGVPVLIGIRVDDKFDFISFLNSDIYSAWVSFPAIVTLNIALSLAGISMIFLLRKTKNSNFHSLNLYVIIFYFSIILQTYYLIMLERKSSIAELFLAFFIFSVPIIYKLFLRRKINLSSLITYLTITFVILISIYFDLPLFNRFLGQIEDQNLSSGRLKAFIDFAEIFGGSRELIWSILFGFGGSDAPGFHNYFLDTIFRVGLIGLTPILLIILQVMFSLINQLKFSFKSYFIGMKLASAIAISSLLIGNIVNVQFSQPIYSCALIFILISFKSYQNFIININNK